MSKYFVFQTKTTSNIKLTPFIKTQLIQIQFSMPLTSNDSPFLKKKKKKKSSNNGRLQLAKSKFACPIIHL